MFFPYMVQMQIQIQLQIQIHVCFFRSLALLAAIYVACDRVCGKSECWKCGDMHLRYFAYK